MAKNLHDQLILPLKLVRLPVPPRPLRREETIIGAFHSGVNIRRRRSFVSSPPYVRTCVVAFQ
jgi:hypothetical protein